MPMSQNWVEGVNVSTSAIVDCGRRLVNQYGMARVKRDRSDGCVSTSTTMLNKHSAVLA